VLSASSSAAASTIQASASAPCCQAEKSMRAPGASPATAMSSTAVTASAGSASQTFRLVSSARDAAFSA